MLKWSFRGAGRRPCPAAYLFWKAHVTYVPAGPSSSFAICRVTNGYKRPEENSIEN